MLASSTYAHDAVPAPIEFEIDTPEYRRIERLRFALKSTLCGKVFLIVLATVTLAFHLSPFGVISAISYIALMAASAANDLLTMRRMRLHPIDGIVRMHFQRDGFWFGGERRALIQWRSVGSVENVDGAVVVMGPNAAPIVCIPKRVCNGDVWSYFERHLIGRNMLVRPRTTDRIVNTVRS